MTICKVNINKWLPVVMIYKFKIFWIWIGCSSLYCYTCEQRVNWLPVQRNKSVKTNAMFHFTSNQQSTQLIIFLRSLGKLTRDRAKCKLFLPTWTELTFAEQCNDSTALKEWRKDIYEAAVVGWLGQLWRCLYWTKKLEALQPSNKKYNFFWRFYGKRFTAIYTL